MTAPEAQPAAASRRTRIVPPAGEVLLALVGAAAIAATVLPLANDIAARLPGSHHDAVQVRDLADIHGWWLALAALVALVALGVGRRLGNGLLRGTAPSVRWIVARIVVASLVAVPTVLGLLELAWMALVARPSGAPGAQHLLAVPGTLLVVLATMALATGVALGADFERLHEVAPREAYLAWAMASSAGGILAAAFTRVQLDTPARVGVGSAAALGIIMSLHLINRPAPEGTASTDLDVEHRLRLRWIPWGVAAAVAVVLVVEIARRQWA